MSANSHLNFRGKVRIIRKSAKRVDGGMNDDAGEQAAAAIKDCDQQESNRDGKDDLAQIAHEIHAAAVEEVDEMPDAEGHAGDDNGGADIILRNGRKQEAPEDHFLQKAHAEHTHDPAGHFRRCVIDRDTVPEVSRRQDQQRHVVEEPAGRDGGPAKPIPLLQAVLPDKGEKHDRLQDAEGSACGVSDPDGFVQRIRQGLQNTINNYPYNCKCQLVFLI